MADEKRARRLVSHGVRGVSVDNSTGNGKDVFGPDHDPAEFRRRYPEDYEQILSARVRRGEVATGHARRSGRPMRDPSSAAPAPEIAPTAPRRSAAAAPRAAFAGVDDD